ncbi:hypothetical protein [Lysobacter gummosus]
MQRHTGGADRHRLSGRGPLSRELQPRCLSLRSRLSLKRIRLI